MSVLRYDMVRYGEIWTGVDDNYVRNYNKCSALCCNTVLNDSTQYNTVQYSTVQYRTVQYNAAQYGTAQYSTHPNVRTAL